MKVSTCRIMPLEMDPSTKAKLEIYALWQKSSSEINFMIGGPTPPEMEKKNQKIRARYAKKEASVVAKYGVIREYALPYLQQIVFAEITIQAAKNRLRLLQEHCKHPKEQSGKCADCGLTLRKKPVT